MRGLVLRKLAWTTSCKLISNPDYSGPKKTANFAVFFRQKFMLDMSSKGFPTVIENLDLYRIKLDFAGLK